MAVFDLLLLTAVTVGALVQTTIGVGFSLFVAPILMSTMGAKAAVPVLLALNIAISLIGVLASRRGDLRDVARPLLGAALGVLAGSLVFPFLSERVVLGLTGGVLIMGTAARPSVPASIDARRIWIAGGLAGLATAWTATPGPVAALGLSRAGVGGDRLRRMLQPFAMASYAMALALTGPEGWRQAGAVDPLILIATSCGAVGGMLVGRRLPSWLILPVIRVLALAAGVVLLVRALMPSSFLL
jgi:uncharacterized protein